MQMASIIFFCLVLSLKKLTDSLANLQNEILFVYDREIQSKIVEILILSTRSIHDIHNVHIQQLCLLPI